MYDYNNGRFLSVDPFIQAPTSTQSMNPYTYVFNNPLSGTDPSGYCSVKDSKEDCIDSLEPGESRDLTDPDNDDEVVGTVTRGEDDTLAVTSVTGDIGSKINNLALKSGITGDAAVLLKADRATENIGGEQERLTFGGFVSGGVKEISRDPKFYLGNTFRLALEQATDETSKDAAQLGAELSIPIPVGYLIKFAGSGTKLGKSFSNWLKGLNISQFGAKFTSRTNLQKHLAKHGDEFGVKTTNQYLALARSVMETGIKVQYKYRGEIRTGYLQFMGLANQGKTSFSKSFAKFAFVGTNNSGRITTLHTKSGKELWRLLNQDNNLKIITPIR